MLGERAIIPRPAAAALAGTLARWVAEGGIAQERLDPGLEDLYINMEHLLALELGPEVSGHLPVARSRNDVEAAMWRIECAKSWRPWSTNCSSTWRSSAAGPRPRPRP